MTISTETAKVAGQNQVTDADLLRICQSFNPGQDFDLAKAVRAEVQSKLRAPVADERHAVDPCGYVAVKRSAVDWLKDKFPALTIKAGLCERIGGRLYTITRLMRDHDAALASAPVAGEAGNTDYIGLALELESAAKRVESQTVRRAMEAGAHGLRLAHSFRNAVPQASAEPKQYTHDEVFGPMESAWNAALEKAAGIVGGSRWSNADMHVSALIAQHIRALKQPQADKDGGQQPQAGENDDNLVGHFGTTVTGVMVTSLASLAYRYAMTLSFATRHADCDQLEGIARRVTAKLKDEIRAIISGQSGSSF